MTPVVIPDIFASVGAVPVTSAFSTTTTDCGDGTFTILDSYTWLTLGSGSIKVTPTLNSEAGVYATLTLQMKLVDYPSAPAVNTTFKVTITSGCATGYGVTPVVIPDISATVGANAVTSPFSTTTTDCGAGTFTILDSYTWLTLVAGSIKVTPTLNSEAGVYATLTLQMKLVDYPSAPAVNTTYKVTITNGCATGYGVVPVVIPDISATVGAAAVTSTFSTTTTDCGAGSFTILDSYTWLTLVSGSIKVTPTLNSEAGVYATLTL